jgi:imidazolonepropionase-like amidohydrolase
MARIVLDNAKVFDGLSAPYAGACVVADGRVAWVGPPGAAPSESGDARYDLAGRFLMPGLVSCHLHPDNLLFGLSNFLAGEQLGKERPPGVLMAVAIRTARMLLDSGFTGYVGAACAHNIDAQLKMAVAEGVVPGPRIRACSHHIGTTADNNDSPRWWAQDHAPGVDLFADGPDEMRRLVRDEIRCGAEIIKFYATSGQAIPNRRGARNMSAEEMRTLVETAHQRGARVRAHVVQRDMILECLDLGVDVIDHGNEVDEACIEKMVETGAFWVPSLLYSRLSLDAGADPAGEYGRAWDNLRRMIPKAQAAGVKLLLGDDYGGAPGRRHEPGVYAREMSLYVDHCGIAPLDVLRWGTRNAGELLVDGPQASGVLGPGAFADLIVVDGDPTADISILQRPQQHLAAVMRDGVFYASRLSAPQAGADVPIPGLQGAGGRA